MSECESDNQFDCPPPDGKYVPPYTIEGEYPPADGGGDLPSSTSRSDDEGPGGLPADDVRTFSFDELSILCHDIGLSPEMVEGVIAQLLTQHFSDPASIIYPELKQYIWKPDSAETKIWIQPLQHWDETFDGKTPAVVYSDAGQKPQRLTIGDQYAHTGDRPGVESFVRAYTGAHRLMCIGQNDFQASQLATEVDRWFTEFAHWITKNLPFHDFQVVDRSQPMSFTALGDRIGVALTLSYSYIWAWETVPYGAPVKSASITFRKPQG